MSLFAVHISDGVLTPAFLGVGIAVALVLVGAALVRMHEDEIPRIALMTAAFFVASLIHVKLGVTSVHLLLNGLLGVVLGRRAPLAIALGLVLQAFLLGHGGFTTLGVNVAVMAMPALAARAMFVALAGRWPPSPRRSFLAGAAAGGVAVTLTVLGNAAVLLFAGVEDFWLIARLVVLAHLPLIPIEALIVGITASYLARVKPEMLGWLRGAPSSVPD